LDFSDALEHRLLAGADALLMPSLYEPCGLTQMRAQRYGTIPIGRRVGGLADTIEDNVTGFLFGEYTRDAFLASVQLASARYTDQEAWKAMMRRAMGQHFGWDRAAEAYLALYRGALHAADGSVTSPRGRVGAGG
jgi:starch synthase